jgi:uncharacterized protein
MLLPYIAFVLGFSGSLHCLGMCGPLIMALPLHNKSMWYKLGSYMFYNLGRILAYVIIGLLVAFLGLQINMPVVQAALSLIMGIMFILSVLLPSFSLYQGLNKRLSAIYFKNFNKLKIGQFSKSMSPGFVVLGLANGFLPCGMVYAAMSMAFIGNTMGHALQYMLFFGLGTLPIMLVLPMAKQIIRLKVNTQLTGIYRVAMLFLGIMLVARSLTMFTQSQQLMYWLHAPLCH